MTAATAATIAKISGLSAKNAVPTSSNTPIIALPIAENAAIALSAPVKTIANLEIKSITPKIGGPSVMNTPANVAIKPNNIPIAGCASVNLAIKSVIATATSNTAAASGAIAVPTLMMILIILPNNVMSLGPFVLI